MAKKSAIERNLQKRIKLAKKYQKKRSIKENYNEQEIRIIKRFELN